MPELLLCSPVMIELSDLHRRQPITKPASAPVRSTGLHQSDVLSYIARLTGKLTKQDELEAELPLIMALGFAWEEFIFSFYPEIIWQPGEREVDGIAMSVDGITGSLEPWGEPAIEEGKNTYKGVYDSAEEMLASNWMWEHAGRNYCGAWGVNTVRWHVNHVRGDYKAFGPVYMQYVVRFSDQEIGQTQAMVRKFRPEVERELAEMELERSMR